MHEWNAFWPRTNVIDSFSPIFAHYASLYTRADEKHTASFIMIYGFAPCLRTSFHNTRLRPSDMATATPVGYNFGLFLLYF